MAEVGTVPIGFILAGVTAGAAATEVAIPGATSHAISLHAQEKYWMIMKSSMTFRAAALTIALTPSLAFAQTAAVPATPTAGVAGSATKAIDDRIAALKASLVITGPETPAWDVFAQAMRDNAANTDAVFAQRAQTAKAMNALQNMQSYAQVARAYADNTQKLSDAFAAVYGQLSPVQRATADLLFREQATPQK